ncbi:helix-turn-helix transcriptional regulator [Bacillus piscicola]|uniref:helix-turn-helix transcriptional regulator n=1 Tax=Bacillus piscicola TaxID=1632684 RepID=UPI001F096DD9|nr:helix-turn-helix transcriptional regulator [Bacillus piscicola]
MDLRNLRLIDLRNKHELTQTELGRLVGLSQSMIAHIEGGTKEPRSKYKVKLAEYFGVTVEWLFYANYRKWA